MLFSHRSKQRPAHLGPLPMETLARSGVSVEDGPNLSETGRHELAEHEYTPTPSESPVARAARLYRRIICDGDEHPIATAVAPVPNDPKRCLQDLRGAAFFMDAAAVGVARIETRDWRGDATDAHTAVVIVVEHGRLPEADNLAHSWLTSALTDIGQLRAGEIATCLSGHIRNMGFEASAHVGSGAALRLEALALRAGVAVLDNDNRLRNPYLGHRFSIAIVATTYRLPFDRPLAPSVSSKGPDLRYWFGINGARSGRERRRRARRRSDLGAYPMEQLRRVDRPTTLILDDEVPQVPKRAAFFERALHGDLGEKAKRERSRFAFKTPLSASQLNVIRRLVPYQDGDVAELSDKDRQTYSDPGANARAIKSLSYALGADITAICEVPRYAWFSHHGDGRPIEPYHRYAIVMVVDQGFDTMEGASGDDWISGSQSMRAYLRGAEIAGVMAEALRQIGFSARAQTNADSDVLQIPLMLLAGLGEMSRIGELVLNPFLGPRLKSVVVTVDMPLEVDKPIDFGLQYFCNNCYKCARECPCDAIPFGDKVMFNGYETWKPDVERCARYRVTNQKGSACGRCMKTCPLNKVIDADGGVFPRIASWLGINAMFTKPLLVPIATRVDDWLGNGRRLAHKKWWFDHEMVDGVAVTPKGTNSRDIDPARQFDASKQKIAYYHADAMPAPDALKVVLVDRKSALAAAQKIETPAMAMARRQRGGATPPHYVPPPRLNARSESKSTKPTSPYASPTSEPKLDD